jgi:hypothetical protein
LGKLRIRTLVLGPQFSMISAGSGWNPRSDGQGTMIGRPPASRIICGNDTQYGASTMASSPGSRRARHMRASACFAPLVITTRVGLRSRPDRSLRRAATAARSSGIPSVCV